MRGDLAPTELSLQQVQKIFSSTFIQQLTKLFLCGNFGDPAMATDCLPILRYFRESHPSLQLGLHSNGGMRDASFWRDLAGVLSYCRFGIDGLKDTNHLYRQGVRWESVERNVRAFIEAGGHAEWDFLVFRHNQHQVEEARALARSWGVARFNVKSTSRFFSSKSQSLRERVEVHDQKGRVSHYLERAEGESFQNPFYEEQASLRERYGTLESYWDRVEIRCKVAAEKSLYVSATGDVLPCCWLGNEVVSRSLHSSTNPFHRLLERLPEKLNSINALEKNLEEIVGNDLFQKLLEESWGQAGLHEGKLKTCARTCGVDSRPFEGQFL